jgi:peroxiredoxin family protein
MNTIELPRIGTNTENSLSAPAAGLKRLAIIIRDDAFDRLLTPLTFAWEMGRQGIEVDILFVLWAVRVLSRDGVNEVKFDPRHAHREAWLRERLQRDGDPLEIHDFLKLVKSTGHVRLHGCRLAAMTFDVNEEILIPEADGIIDPGDFLREIAVHADHCQYF